MKSRNPVRQITGAAFVTLLMSIPTTKAFALPEFIRFGYFNCTSCHASPAGGGLLTDYGRSIASERVSTWAKTAKEGEVGEEGVLHGLVKKPDWFLAGGDVRLLQTYVETPQVKEGRYIPMQRDLELGVTASGFWLVASGGLVKKVDGDGDEEQRFQVQHYFARYDIGESLILRLGHFNPRFGLMIPHHTSVIRRGLGFDQGTQTNNAEATWSNEQFEVTATGLLGEKALPKADHEEKEAKGFGLTAAHYLLETHRISLSYMRRNLENDVREQLAGVNGIFKLSETWHLLSEVDQRITETPALSGNGKDMKRGLVSFNRLGFEAYRGVVPYFLHEARFTDLSEGDSRVDLYGLGINFFPRPHFEIEAQAAQTLIRRTYGYVTSGYLIAHYYL